jgi:hypothetical protein
MHPFYTMLPKQARISNKTLEIQKQIRILSTTDNMAK